MTIDEMNAKRMELGLTYRYIAGKADMPLSTVQKIFGGLTKAPRKENLIKIQQVLQQEEAIQPFTRQNSSAVLNNHVAASTRSYTIPQAPILTVAEQTLNYGTSARRQKKQGEFTIEDYYALPDDCRAELIDGVLYDMTAPVPSHQLIAGSLYSQLLQFRNRKKGPCLPMISPVDVQLDCDNKTMLEPDVMIVCDRSKIIRRCIYGAPDFVVEVLSPSTRKKDMSVKMQKYISAGVREYWMVDPDRRMVVVYDTEHLALPELYTFHDIIPVKVWKGECQISLADVDEILDELYGPESAADSLTDK